LLRIIEKHELKNWRRCTNMGNKDFSILIQTLVKGLDVLECFTSDVDEKGIKEISESIDIPESSVHRILQTLEYKGLVIQNEENKKYRLGLKLLVYARKATNMLEWKEKAKYWMKELNKQCGETVNLAIRDEENIVYIDKVDSSHLLRPNFVIGHYYPSHCTSLGRMLLSDTGIQNLDALIEGSVKKYSADTDYDIERIKQEVYKARERGYALDDEEFQPGLRCVAAPIKAFGGKVIAAISITSPTVRLDDKKYSQLTCLVVETAARISEEINKLKA
jgi:DNA-binding IclR family transcriptional regulator